MAKIYTDIELRDPKELTPYAHNAKKHPPDQIDRLAGQIAAHGFDQPIVVDRQGVIVKGHGRRQAAVQLGLTAVPVVVSDLDEHQARAARIADNQLASLEYDTKNLELDLGMLKDAGLDMSLTGLGGDQIDQIFQGLNFEMPQAQVSDADSPNSNSDEPADDHRVEYVKVGPKKIPATPEEVEELTEACRAYEADHGTAFGFWTSLIR